MAATPARTARKNATPNQRGTPGWSGSLLSQPHRRHRRPPIRSPPPAMPCGTLREHRSTWGRRRRGPAHTTSMTAIPKPEPGPCWALEDIPQDLTTTCFLAAGQATSGLSRGEQLTAGRREPSLDSLVWSDARGGSRDATALDGGPAGVLGPVIELGDDAERVTAPPASYRPYSFE